MKWVIIAFIFYCYISCPREQDKNYVSKTDRQIKQEAFEKQFIKEIIEGEYYK